MRIGRFDLAERVLVMAEIGNNHEGRPEIARELLQRAAEAGAGAIKLQIFEARRFVRPSQPHRLEQLSRFQLPREEVEGLCDLARELGLVVVATPLDTETVGYVAPMVDGLKIASGDNDCYPLIERVAEVGKPMIISAGMADSAEIKASIEAARARWREANIEQELAILHCVSAYPVEAAAANLERIESLRRELDCTVGYSDHTIGIEASVIAAGLGARIIEKHFTLSHDFSDFRDHKLSANPAELAELVRRVEAAGSMRGPDEDARSSNEHPNRETLRRSIVAATDLSRGHRLRLEDLTWMRPRDGLAPGEEHRLVGRALVRDVSVGEALLPSDVEEP